MMPYLVDMTSHKFLVISCQIDHLKSCKVTRLPQIGSASFGKIEGGSVGPQSGKGLTKSRVNQAETCEDWVDMTKQSACVHYFLFSLNLICTTLPLQRSRILIGGLRSLLIEMMAWQQIYETVTRDLKFITKWRGSSRSGLWRVFYNLKTPHVDAVVAWLCHGSPKQIILTAQTLWSSPNTIHSSTYTSRWSMGQCARNSSPNDFAS